MKVLVVADAVGGVRTFIEELVRSRLGTATRLHLALLGQDPIDWAGARSCELRALRLEWMADAWNDVCATGEWIEQLRLLHRPDAIHMNTFAPVLDPHVPVLLTVHSCVLTWWRAVHGEDAPPSWERYKRLARQALDRADLVTVPSRALLDELTAVHGYLPHARVIPNGRSVAEPVPQPRERLVVTVGRLWDEAKNAALVADGAPAIDGRVALIGPGEVAGVETLGRLAPGDVLRWLRRAAVFAEPARYEPFGLAALEAALCGCALVLGDIPSLREVWGDAALYVSPDDSEHLASTINALLDSPERLRRTAAAARSRARRYTRQAMANGYLRAYRELAPMAVAA